MVNLTRNRLLHDKQHGFALPHASQNRATRWHMPAEAQNSRAVAIVKLLSYNLADHPAEG